jgi:uncharacterized protein YbjT (DUF2867 family)
VRKGFAATMGHSNDRVNAPAPATVRDLEDVLSLPGADDRQASKRIAGDILVLGAGGKMGPSLARLARRASDEAGVPRRIMAVSRFRTPGTAGALAAAGVEPLAEDLLDPGALDRLPDAPNVILMVGQKFGTHDDPTGTWAVNALVPGLVARRYRESRIVTFSTGNVYHLVSAKGRGAVESDPLAPIGEYAQSAVARERVLSYLSEHQRTPMTLLRLNYAVELRYGVLRDLADCVWRGEPVDLAMGYVNVIWQRDACSIALRALERCGVPPFVVNVAGLERLRVRDLATRLGDRLGRRPVFVGEEADTALLSDASLCVRTFGPPSFPLDAQLDWVAEWVRRGGPSLGRPTHFERRDGQF